MNLKQRRRWEKFRRKGILFFIFFSVAVFTAGSVSAHIFLELVTGNPWPTGRDLIPRAEAGIIVGLLWGLSMWHINEAQYARSTLRALAVVDDLFFVSKLQETAKQVGAELRIERAADFRADSLRAAKPALAVFDLNATSANPVELIRQLKADPELKGIPIIAFLSHVQVDLQRAAQAAGADQVLPRSKFTATLADILRQANT